MRKLKTIALPIPCGIALAALLCRAALAQEPAADLDGIEMMAAAVVPVAIAAAEDPIEDTGEIEELVVLGRFIYSSQQLVNERMGDAFAADLLGADTIARLGDSTVGAALRRVPGITLVQDKFVYIRGLGERYTQTTLNGAQIPSPDLTRNVIPLDVFPTSIVESLRVQKSYSPDLSANFGGGSVDIRTKGIPDSFTTQLEISSGWNSENPSKVNSYSGGGDDSLGTDDGTRALSSTILTAVNNYQGDPSVNNILNFLQRQDSSASLFDAQSENRDLALALNRNIDIEEESVNPDIKARVSIGNKFDVGTDTQLGFNVGASYQTDSRWRRTTTAAFAVPEEQNGVREEATESVNIAGTLNLGASFLGEHDISSTTLYLRNTDDETEVFDFFNENRVRSSGLGFRDYRLEFEERNMLTNQVTGSHYLGAATREAIPFLGKLVKWAPEETHIDWFWSDSTAETEIPSRVLVSSETRTDPVTGEVLDESVRLTSSAADYRFTDLDDEVENYGWSATLPWTTGNSYVEFSGGYDHGQKVRTYYQAQFSLGYLNVSDPSVLEGSLGEVFSDSNILTASTGSGGNQTYANNIVFDRQGSNTNSYLAATMTDAAWGKIDWTWNETWRVAAGARWEDYRQTAVSWNPFGYSEDDPQVTTDVETLESGSFNEDTVYPTISTTYMGDFWAETFQLRLAYSETAVRPDLREITASSYVDPITGDLIRGNPGIVPADMENIDLRAEWYFESGDNLTVTLFHKDIENPIEFFEIPASDTTIAREVVNAESATLNGIEFEGLKELGFLGGFFDTMFMQGNLTLQDSELIAGANANSPTNLSRPLTGASEYVANIMLGYDSPNARHTASVIYNIFGERLFVAGRNGAPDGYEQPFESLDFTYFWYPTERMTVKLVAQNILGSTIDIEREGVVVFQEDPGTTVAIAFAWKL
ncbi:MAG: TonB-dependent receptor plug domain-containing protein [Proteobacteria bacterium]|nr:TonB-dependent receptor plug domain-containing protein [Pseudomonadota bacterium]